jgi:hypothetical protein
MKTTSVKDETGIVVKVNNGASQPERAISNTRISERQLEAVNLATNS